MRTMGELVVREEKHSAEIRAELSLCKGRQYFFYSITLKYWWKNESERWKVIRFDLMAKTLSIFYLPIHKRIEGTVMGWQIPVPYKLPMILN